jgi:hypothetical protein
MGLGYLLAKPALRRTDALQARFSRKASTGSAASAKTSASAIVASSVATPPATTPATAPPRPRTTAGAAGAADRTGPGGRIANGSPGRPELTLPRPSPPPADPAKTGANSGPNSGSGPGIGPGIGSGVGSGVGPEATVPDGEPAARS